MTAVILSGPWTAESAQQRLRNALGKTGRRAKWPEVLIAAVFGEKRLGTPPSAKLLQAFLLSSEVFDRFSSRIVNSIVEWAETFSLTQLPPERMQPRCLAALNWNVPAVVTAGALAELTGIEIRHLVALTKRRAVEHTTEHEKLRNYRYGWVRKRSGGLRLLESPKQRLKHVQRVILREILEQVPTHNAAHGFCRNRSTRTAAAVHTNSYVVLRIDLQDFFPCIPAARVAGIFRSLGYPSRVVSLLTALCVNTAWKGIMDEVGSVDLYPEMHKRLAPLFRPHLPQGAPTSPSLANLCAYSLDCRLEGLANTFGGRYTRYADDLVFSGDRRFASSLTKFRVLALAIVLDEGFEIRKRKTAVMYAHERQSVCGIVVNQSPTIARPEFDQLKATLHNCVRHGPASQNHSEHANFRAHIEGRVAYVSSINQSRGDKLRKLLNKVDWLK